MLRISLQQEPPLTRIRLEGRLAGPWVQEVDHVASQISGALEIDLNHVTTIDQSGYNLLKSLKQQGARLSTSCDLLAAIVERS